jgi:hypothetical protein
MLTVAEQQVLMKRYGFDDGDPIIDWLNAAMHDIEAMSDWPWLEQEASIATVAGNNLLPLAVTHFKVISVRDMTNNKKLQMMDRTQFDREIFDPTITGNPRFYIIQSPGYGELIQLYPVPSSIFQMQVFYVAQCTDVVAGSTSPPPIPEILHYPMVVHAAYLALMAENEEDRAQTAQKQFETMMNNVRLRYGARTSDEPEQVVDAMRYEHTWGP